ncbi:MAG: protein adenylyltransferase SelO, partial [Burkholderiales bacterium]
MLKFDNSYATELPGFSAPWTPANVPRPTIIKFNQSLADELGLDAPWDASVFAGGAVPVGAQPVAQAYAGHQFGGFSPQLGDGRAVLLGEVIDRHGLRRDIALKGSGRTPYSRGGDGKAALGPVLREYLISEAMHALSIPTTRTLAAAGTGETIRRELPQPGAVLTRVAASHIRVGTFQYFAARRETDKVRLLADYVIARHDPALREHPQRYLELLRAVAERQASLIARWMNIGFIHGVMNTDNMTISGETIDFGPCAFMEAYDPKTVFSSIDSQGRYAYGNQPLIARWNIARLAEALLPLIDSDPDRAVEQATVVIDEFVDRYEAHWLAGVRAKLGISAAAATDDAGDRVLANDWLTLLEANAVDFTLGWRYLADVAQAADTTDRLSRLHDLFHARPALEAWLVRWRERAAREPMAPTDRVRAMRQTNPLYIPRNHRVEAALDAAREGDLGPFERLLAVITHPFEE